MPKPTPASPDAYVAGLPEDRQAIVSALRDLLNAHKPDGVVECIQYGMLGWAVPHGVYPDGYHCNPAEPVPYAHVANQKAKVSLYLFCLYVDSELVEWFRASAQAAGYRLDMGKSCIRFKRLEDVPLELLAEALQRMPLEGFLARYTAAIPASARKKRPR